MCVMCKRPQRHGGTEKARLKMMCGIEGRSSRSQSSNLQILEYQIFKLIFRPINFGRENLDLPPDKYPFPTAFYFLRHIRKPSKLYCRCAGRAGRLFLMMRSFFAARLWAPEGSDTPDKHLLFFSTSLLIRLENRKFPN